MSCKMSWVAWTTLWFSLLFCLSNKNNRLHFRLNHSINASRLKWETELCSIRQYQMLSIQMTSFRRFWNMLWQQSYFQKEHCILKIQRKFCKSMDTPVNDKYIVKAEQSMKQFYTLSNLSHITWYKYALDFKKSNLCHITSLQPQTWKAQTTLALCLYNKSSCKGKTSCHNICWLQCETRQNNILATFTKQYLITATTIHLTILSWL